MATEVGTVSTKGQVTIPKDIRDALRIGPGDKLLFDIEGGDRALVRRAEPTRLSQIFDRAGPSEDRGVEAQRRLRNEWAQSGRRH